MSRLCVIILLSPLWLAAWTTPAETGEAETIKRLDRGLDWGYCSPPGIEQGVPPLIEPGRPDVIYLDAESADYDQVSRIIRLEQAALRQNDTYLEADRIIYHRPSHSADLWHDIYLEKPDLRLTSDAGEMQMNQHRGRFSKVEYRLPESKVRGTADQARMLSKTLTRYREVDLTTCPPGTRDWSLSASELEIDQESGWGEAYHAVLRLGRVPVLYTPYFNFPIDDRRKTGFLFPSFGTSEDLGTEFSIPYYLNLAPHYDATLTPRWMSRRGLMLGGEFRYLGERQYGTLSAEVLNDKVESDLHDTRRSAFRVTHRSNPLPGLSTRIDAAEVSDMQYLNDFSTGLANTSTRYLERIAEAGYRTGDWRFIAQVQDFQTVDALLDPRDYPYSLMPRLRADYRHLSAVHRLDLGLMSEYSYFEHDTRLTGQRLRLAPSLGLQLFRRPWAHLIPRATLQYAGYRLHETDPAQTENPAYLVPTLSLDSGLVFERASRWFGANASQTLEPRLYYLYAPYEDQSDIPDFDTSDLELSFATLFKDNRFIGGDRVGDANQLALGVTTRWLETATGVERLRASIGQIYYFQDREVQLAGAAAEQSESAVVAELGARLGAHWRSSLNLRWDPSLDEDQIDKGRIGLQYRNTNRRLFNIGYNYDDRNQIEDLDLSFYWRFDYRYSIMGAWKHSLFHGRDLNRVFGVEYGGRCCWKLRALYQEYVTETDLDVNVEQEAEVRFMLQMELRGLGGLGQDVQQTLQESIYGYQPE